MRHGDGIQRQVRLILRDAEGGNGGSFIRNRSQGVCCPEPATQAEEPVLVCSADGERIPCRVNRRGNAPRPAENTRSRASSKCTGTAAGERHLPSGSCNDCEGYRTLETTGSEKTFVGISPRRPFVLRIPTNADNRVIGSTAPLFAFSGMP